ncbi:putative WEB family protein At1g65010, chloroplastic isoform X3 [Lates japonicus]|uniref:WEB family protein At1g65010, chloroplastic isoform X3 n=1 Tax=Lates japonicus TaxID=270547 RepID=A0AAD3MVG8_LATJO|nr:putative WEB family protein At1g65010, chloroplastic isoform X3 [Lates japonicus]
MADGCRTYHENNTKFQSKVREFELEKKLRVKEIHYEKQQEDLHKLLMQHMELNSKLGARVLDMAELGAEMTRLRESVCLLSTAQSVSERNDTLERELEVDILVVREEKKNMTAKLTQLESLTERHRIDNENLWTAIQVLQENEKTFNEKNKTLAGEGESNQEEIECLRAAVRDLQCQVEDAQQLILNKDELIAKKDQEIAYNQQVIWKYCLFTSGPKPPCHDLKRHTSQEEDPEEQKDKCQQETPVAAVCDQVEEAQQNDSDKVELLQKLAEHEHLTEKLQTENKNLLATVQDLQESNNSLSDQCKTISAEFVLLESQTEKKQAEIDALQENERVINERNKNLTDEVERNQREIEHLTAAVRDLQCQVKVAQEEHSDKDEITQKLSPVESLLEEKQAEITKLTTALHEFQEKEEFMIEANNVVIMEMAQLESLRKKQVEEIKYLRFTVQDLQYQVDDGEERILIRDEQITKLKKEIASKQKTIEEWCTLTAEMRQSIRDLKDHLLMKQEEDILDGTQNFREESRACAEHTELEIFEEARDQTLQDTPSAEPQQLEVPSAEPQHLEVPFAEPQQLEVPFTEPQQLEVPSTEPQQLEVPSTEPQQLEASSAEPQQLEASSAEPQWRHRAKWLLKAGLQIGMGMLIPAAILTAKVTANCWDCGSLLEPYCNFPQGQHPF